MRLALVGNPNVGKTTLFNCLTGSHQYVGNWPGVTVEKKQGRLKNNTDIELVDLPGIYSLSPYTKEEIISRDYLLSGDVDGIINIIDATNLERNLFLTTQLMELNIPIIVAINMADIARKRNITIDIDKMGEALGVSCVEISALKKQGIDKLLTVLNKPLSTSSNHITFASTIEHTITQISKQFLLNINPQFKRWYAIKLFEKDHNIIQKLHLSNKAVDEVVQPIYQSLDDDGESLISCERYCFIDKYLSSFITTNQDHSNNTLSLKIDRLLTNRFLALPIFALVMWAVYYIAVSSLGTIATDWTNDVLFGEIVPSMVQQGLNYLHVSPWLQSLVLDGIVAGVGAVLGFVPQLLILFFLLSLLEECGYMARVSFILDRLFRYFGLNGKSFIPMLIGSGCSIPGIMASRTIEDEASRRLTVMTTSFIPCGAKLPVIALISGALFGGASWIAPSCYFLGIIAILCSGIILKKTKGFKNHYSPFIMELPDYHLPSMKMVLKTTWNRGSSFIKKAGTIILMCTIVLWFLSNFGYVDHQIKMVDDLSQGFLANIGNALAWLFRPLGFGNWQATVATFTGLIAKENVVSTFGVVYGFGGELAEDGQQIWNVLAQHFNMISAYSFLAFNLLCAPCFAAIGAIRREMQSAKWTIFAITYQCILAYAVSLCIYQLGSFMLSGIFTIWTLVAIVVVVGFIYLLLRKERN